MYTLVSIFVLGCLGLSTGLPVEDASNSERYNPEAFYASWRGQESSGRIVGGSEAPDGAAPHMVAIALKGILMSLVCGGFMISDKVIGTAGHCIEPMIPWDNPGTLMDTARGLIGSNSLSRDYTLVEFSEFLIHPEYNSMTIKYDVGLLWLTQSVLMNDLVQPIALGYERIGGGQRLSVTGFGRLDAWGALPDRLQKLEVFSLSHEECLAGVQRARDDLGFSPDVDGVVEICTMHPRGSGHGMCNGDSGSALWLEKRGKDNRVIREAVGVVSWGFACALGYPDMYARISSFKEFFEPNVKSEI